MPAAPGKGSVLRMSDTVFGKILRGELPCHRVYENEHVLAFLDVAPLSVGHTLVIPKVAARTLDELSDAAAAALGEALPRIARAIKSVTGCDGYNVLQNNEAVAGQSVFHVHFHIIPRTEGGDGLSWGRARLTPAEATAEVAASLSAAIE